MNRSLPAGRRYVESAAYRDALARAGGSPDRLVHLLAEAGPVPVLEDDETRAALKLRTFANLYPFSIDGTAYAGELPAAFTVPQAVETIPTSKLQVETGVESAEDMLASSVPDGTPLPEGSLATSTATPTLDTLDRFGVSLPVSVGVLDDPGRMASLINRRIELGLGLGLENDILLGNNQWGGAVAAATETVAKSAGQFRVDALVEAAGAVQGVGWYTRPLQIVTNPVTKGNVFTERDTTGRPVPVNEMLRDFVDPKPAPLILGSKFMPAGTALVGDLFNALALFTNGDLTVSISRVHQDFLTRGMVELKLEFRAFLWVRQPAALAAVTGIA